MQPLLIVSNDQFMYPIYGIRKFNGLRFNELLRNVNSKLRKVLRMGCTWLINCTKQKALTENSIRASHQSMKYLKSM